MSRPLRIEFPGAVYHVTARGDRREPIYRDVDDRRTQLALIAQAMDRFDGQVLAYCLMGNHFHLVLYTRQANLSRLMRHVNGVYTQAFNRRHGLVGHLLQGRFKAILVDRDAYLMALCRYVERNPVAAGLVPRPQDWPWSSCRAHLGLAPTPAWLDSDGLHAYLLGRAVAGAADRQRACKLYGKLVEQAGAGDATFWQQGLRRQIYLGDEQFVAQALAQASPSRTRAKEVPTRQRQALTPATPEAAWALALGRDADRNNALWIAYREFGVTMGALARLSKLSVSRVSRLIAKAEGVAEGVAKGKT